MDSYQNRVVDEKAELDLKIQKLIDFIATPKFKELAADDCALLQQQLSWMQGYSYVLNQRIARFT